MFHVKHQYMKKLVFLLILPFVVHAAPKQKIDLLIFAGKIYTVDPAFSTVTGMAVNKGKIVALGLKADLKAKYAAAKVIDEPEKSVYPGFIDAHCHFSGYALDGYKCELWGTKSYEEVLQKLINYEKTNKFGWIYGRGWDQNDWAVKEFPTKKELDSLFPNKPVILKRVDGHAILCNQYALDKAGINNATFIDGGMVVRNMGQLSGVLIDNAMQPVEDLIPNLPEPTAVDFLKKAEKECFANGLTGVVDCGITGYSIELLKKLYTNNTLSIDNTVLLSSDAATLKKYASSGPSKTGRLKISGIKVYADGALGSRGACLLADYKDMPGHRGMMLTAITQMDSIADIALKYNWQLCTHAIGDSANRTVLKLYASKLGIKNDKRWRIEHAQVVDQADYFYFKRFSIIPSVQPTHAISDMPWAENRLGENRIQNAYSYSHLMQQNNWLPLGTDFPVEAINPLATFYTAVARKDSKGNPPEGFLPENAMSTENALRGMTIWAAKSVFNEKNTGSLEVGKNADIVILDQDILSLPENKILDTKVIYTIANGKVVYNQQ